MISYYQNVIYEYKKLNQKVKKNFNSTMEIFNSKLNEKSNSMFNWMFHQNPALIGERVDAIMRGL